MKPDILRVVINFMWDPEAEVWIATSEQVPGLVLEGGSFDALAERVKFAVPELLELNGLSGEALLNYHTEREEMVYA